jgi:hypothetical protein
MPGLRPHKIQSYWQILKTIKELAEPGKGDCIGSIPCFAGRMFFHLKDIRHRMLEFPAGASCSSGRRRTHNHKIPAK